MQKFHRKSLIGNSKYVFLWSERPQQIAVSSKGKAKNEAQRKDKVKTEKQENYVIDIDEMSDEFYYLDELSEA
jgi:DNA polymerase III alpha subunit (gram-positive type)